MNSAFESRSPQGLDLSQGLHAAQRLATETLASMKAEFVGKDEIIDLMGVCLVGGENLFLHGPPGTAKSALVHALAGRLEGRVFDYLLTRFTEPNELFGPLDIRRLREGELVTNTEGMLPEASFIFLDELLNANSAILNSLLAVLNEKMFRRGRERRPVPALMVVGASNRLPEDEALAALFDRFPIRVRCDNVPQEQLPSVLEAGWQLLLRGATAAEQPAVAAPLEHVQIAQRAVLEVDVRGVREAYVELVHRLRHAGMALSDRRAVRLQKLAAASALLAGRTEVDQSDLWVLRYIWDREDQQQVLAGIVQAFVDRGAADPAARHVRSRGPDLPDPDQLAADVQRIEQQAANAPDDPLHLRLLRDQLAVLRGRVPWLAEQQHRDYLQQRIADVAARLAPAEGVP